MLAAIYARKSTKEDKADDEKSVARQVKHGLAYIAKKGWRLAGDGEEFIYKDDAISGAEFTKRVHLVRLLRDLERKPRPPFHVLVMSEDSRLGRESIETAYVLKQIVQAGVRVFYYLTDTERTLDGPMDKMAAALAAFADDLERVKAQQRTTDALMRKAQAGHVTGGIVFGYDNVEVLDATEKPSHVERRINQAQGAIVTQIFVWYVSGWGYARIAKTLNAMKAPCPRPNEDKPAGWSPSSVRSILRRDLYRGVVIWNRSKKRDNWGRQNQTARPEAEWIQLPVNENVRIISDELWQQAQDRRMQTRQMLSTATGERPIVRRDIGSKYLLSGFARCAKCGWSMTVVTRSHGQRRKAFLACLSHYKRGPQVCPNGQIVPLDRADEAVLAALKADALDPSVVSTIVHMVFERLAPSALGAKLAAFEEELHDVEGVIANLARAIERAPDLDPLIAQMRGRQQERTRLQQEIASARALRQVQLDATRIEAEVQAAVANWRETLATTAVEGGRALLREVLSGPLVFQPTAEGYTFRGPVILGDLIAGAVNDGVQQAGAHKDSSPTGFEPVFWP